METKEDKLFINHIVETLKRGKNTKFLNQKELRLVIPILNKLKINYQVYTPYINAEKVILYSEKKPDISALVIQSSKIFRHQDILGSIFSLAIEIENFGDIIQNESGTFIILFTPIKEYVQFHLSMIGNTFVELLDYDIKLLSSYEKKYEELTIITSSLRIDSIVGRLAHCSRKNALDIIQNKNVLLNYELVTNPSSQLHEGDVFSIKSFGKYKFSGIKKNTKSHNMVLSILKY